MIKRDDSRKKTSGLGLKKRSLIALLKPYDVLMFRDNGREEYLIVERIEHEKILGKYISDSKIERKSMSMDEIVEREPRVAYLQEILSAQ